MQEQQPVIWIVSYPKSGNTWMRSLLREYFLMSTGDEPFESNDTVPYYYHTVSPRPLESLGSHELAQIRPAAMMHMLALHKSRIKSAPCILVKSHMLSAEFHGIPLFSPLWMNKAIYIHRDPRDILPSYADHMGHDHARTVEIMNNPTAEIGVPPAVPSVTSSWSNHVMSWVDNERVNTCVTSYEKMHEDPWAVLEGVLKFCGVEPNMDVFDDVIEASKFSKMQALETKQGFCEKTKHQEKFFRRGIVGSHKDEVVEFHIKQIEHDHKGMMVSLGYLNE